MGLLGQMTVMFGADTGGLTRGISTAQSALKSLADNPTAAVGQGLLVAGAAAVGFAIQSVDAASAFQQSMLKVQAYAGLTKQQTDDMSTSIMNMSTQLGQSPKAMADAIYPIISSGYSASQALSILSLSAKTAAASGANMSVVADMLTTSLKASGAPASQAGHYMDMFNKIVSLGKGEVPAYAAVIGKLTLAAGSAHVPFDQMGAALATLTTHGFPSVAQASNALGNLFTQIGPKVDALATHAAKLGLSFDENKFKTMDLSDKLAYLQKITGGNQGELLKLVGGSTLALKAFSALSGSSADFASNMKQMQNATGATDAAFAVASGGFNASMARMNAAVEVLKIKVGSALLPALTQVTNAVTPLIGSFASVVTSASPVTKMFTGMADNWLDFADSVNTGPIVSAFNGLKASAQSLSVPFSLLGVMLNNINNFLIDTAGYVSGLVAPVLTMLSQVVRGVGGVLQTIALSVSGNLLPALHNLVAAVAPIVTAFVQWVAQSNIIPTVFSVLQVAVGLLIQGISLLVNILAGLITFFSQNAVGIAIFRAALILIGTVLGVIAAVAIPLLIQALVDMGIAAIAAGIEMVIAFAPIVLPILAIIAVIALVVLAVTHWGQIAHWIQGVWSAAMGAIGAFFTDMKNRAGANMTQLGQQIQSVVGTIGNFFTNTWHSIQSKTSQFMSFLGGAIQTGMKAVLDFFMAPINLMGQAFVWLYDHNRYIKLMVDTIVQDVTRLSSWLSNTWKVITSTVTETFALIVATARVYWDLIYMTIQIKVAQAQIYLNGIWKAITSTVKETFALIVATARVYWDLIYMTIQIKMAQAQIYLNGIWRTITNTVSNAANAVWQKIVSMWQQISGVFASAYNTYIGGPLSSVWNSINSTIQGWINQAEQFGANFMHMLAQGITNGIGDVGAAASNAAGQLKKFLGFSSPTELGPGSNAHVWMPNLINMMASGLVAGVPKMTDAVQQVAKPLAALSSPQSLSASSNSLGSVSTSHLTTPLDLSNGTSNGSAQGSASTGGTKQQTLILQIDSREFARATGPAMGEEMTRLIRLSGRAA